MSRIRNDRSGFTLVELMIVVVIVGILAVLAIPRFAGTARETRQAEAGPILKQICVLAEADRLRTGQWPAGLPRGFEDPNSTNFSFTQANGTATATAENNLVQNQRMDCATYAITDA